MSEVLPDTPVGRQLEWVFGLLEGGGEPELDEIRERLTASFMTAVPVEQFVVVTEQAAGALKGFTFDRFEQGPTPTQAVAVLTLPNGDAFRVRIAVEERTPHRIAGLFLQPAPDLRAAPAASSWEELEDKLRPLASRVGFLAAELNGRDLAPVFEIEPDLHLGIGSAFKLYVLGELARQVSAGSIGWDDELEISDRHRSVPSGVMQDAEAGSRYPVREFAEKMISISDNTATDHLLDRLGRKRVEPSRRPWGTRTPRATCRSCPGAR